MFYSPPLQWIITVRCTVYGIYRPPELASLPVYGVYIYGCMWCIWHIQTPRAHGPTAPYMMYIMAWRIWHIHTHTAGPTALYCIWCIWHIQTPRARAPTSLSMMYIWHGLQYTAYTDPHSWSHSPRLYMVYMAVYGVYAIYRSPRAGAKALYGVYDILRPPDLTPQSCMRYIYGCIWCIWHIQTPRAGPTALYMVCMAVCRHPYTNIYTWGHVYGVYICVYMLYIQA